jgi:hypothetical protein
MWSGRPWPNSSDSGDGPGKVVTVDDTQFQSLVEQVRDLHRLADELTRDRTRLEANVRARLRWDERGAPPLPGPQREIADEAVEILSKPRLSASQSKTLRQAFFGR